MCLFSKKDHMAHWRSDSALRHQIEGAAFELLGSLCEASQNGRKAVAAAEECEACTDRAIEIVGSSIDDTTTVGDNGGAEVDDVDDDDELAMLQPPPYEATIEAAATKAEGSDSDLCASALAFLSSLAAVPAIRKELVENDHFVKASSALVKSDCSLSLRYQAIKLITSLAPFATNKSILNVDLVADVLVDVLDAEGVSNNVSSEVNSNLVHGAAVAGLQIAFNSLAGEKQLKVAQSVVSRFSKSVKSLTIAKGDKLYRGEVIYNMTLILLLARGKNSTEEAFTGPLLASLVNMIQWRHDPKTKLEGAEASLLGASVTHCLQILFFTLMTTDERVAQLGIKKSELSNTVLMVARPGKAPRKAIDLMSALSKAMEGNDVTGSIAAKNLQILLS
jgi:hypothetical protein